LVDMGRLTARGFVQHLKKKSPDGGDQCDVEPGTASIEGARSEGITSSIRRVVQAAVNPGTVVGVGSNYKILRCDRPDSEQFCRRD
jgi:hypothetical protein